MKKRIIICGLALVGVMAGLTTVVPSIAQDYPTANAATIDAMVRQRFDATQSYAAFGTLNATIDAAFAVAQTATAAVQLAPTIPLTPTPLSPDATGSIPTETPIPPTSEPLASVSSEFVFIPAVDNFQMGTTLNEVAQAVNQCTIEEQGNCTVDMAQDSLPVHTVKLTAFQMQRNEVTVGEYLNFLNSRGPGSHLNGCDGQACALTQDQDKSSPIAYDGKVYSAANNVPMYKVTWYGAKAFCEAAGGRLPSEAEWEYAARGTDGRIYPWGNTWDPLSARTSIPVTTNVGPVAINSYPSGLSPFGLFDMAGNVAEWVNDWYDPAYYSNPEATGTDPAGPAAGSQKVVRGGSWDSKPFFARSVHRQSLDPTAATNGTGFRCAAKATDIIPTLTPAFTETISFTVTPSPSSQANLVVSPTASLSNPQPTLTQTAAG
ncbi:MAG: formylglycine-generating enzyme family protein [Anaerolineae bacterium]|nr:formylglycine-generating enzyme family protein [Anaerolineae bacterium]